MRHPFKHLLLAVLLSGLLLAAPVLAQETAAETTEEAAPAVPGISTLVFLLGAGAIIIVGGALIARDNFQSDNNDSAR